jgi:hypothetical protein
MSTSSVQVTAFSKSRGTKILSFGCHVPNDLQHGPTLSDENLDFDDPLEIKKVNNQLAMPHPLPDIGSIENVGIVGTVTLFGRSTAMVWVGWGRLQKKHSQGASEVITKRSLGAGASN